MKVSSELVYQAALSDLSPFLLLKGAPERSWRCTAAVALLDSLFKKYLDNDSVSKEADRKALELFLSVNEGLLNSPRPAETLMDQHLLGELKLSLDKFWFKSATDGVVGNLHELFLNGRVGPGSSLGSPSTDQYTKLFDCRLTAASQLLYKSYSRSLQNLDRFLAAEVRRKEVHGDCDFVKQSKLLFVPKRNDISRTICVEPNLNMFYQLGMAQMLQARLRQVYNIRLDVQPDYNRELAQLGSIDGNYSTIDLSSASDSLSLGVLQEILPREMYSWLCLLRTPETKLPDGRVVPLRMISTMGNGFTFPLQTIIFAAVVEAAYKVAGVPLIRNARNPNVPSVGNGVGNFGVFGDDIIVRTECTNMTLRLLYLLGFQVNSDKTFTEGPFRESCGNDFYSGHFVRGVYIKSLRTPQDRYIAINLLNDWSATTGIHLSRTVQYLMSGLSRVFVSPLLGLDAGIQVPSSMIKASFDRNGSFRCRYFEQKPFIVKVKEDGSFSRYWGKRDPNPDGLVLSFLAGYVRSHMISLRHDGGRYVMKRCILPNWEDRKSVV